MKKSTITLIVIIVLVVLGVIYYPYFRPAPEVTPPPEIEIPASLTVSDQSLVGNEVVIDGFFLDKPGYVVIHKDADGKPGPVIGNSELVSGSQSNFKVTIDAGQAGSRIFAMLHYDDDNDGQYGFPDEDKPVFVDEKIVVKPINLVE